MEIAILTVTQGGKELGLKLKEFFPKGQLYVLPQFYENEEAILPIDPDLKTVVKELFYKVDYLIFIMATGIVVRTIAPYIRHKSQDPGILVMDEKGENVISLLSGHIGGANTLTIKVADLLNANPVITTASDVQKKVAVDTLAQQFNCKIIDWQLTKKITAYIVNGGRVATYWEEAPTDHLPNSYEMLGDFAELFNKPYGIYIGNTPMEKQSPNILQIYPQNLVLGIGCRRGVASDVILQEITMALKEVNKEIKSVKKIATVDVKAEEEGLIQAARALNLPLEIVSRQRIKEVEKIFESSDFVKKTIGVGSVSEPCAYIGSEEGKLLMRKRKNRGVTISIAQEGERR